MSTLFSMPKPQAFNSSGDPVSGAHVADGGDPGHEGVAREVGGLEGGDHERGFEKGRHGVRAGVETHVDVGVDKAGEKCDAFQGNPPAPLRRGEIFLGNLEDAIALDQDGGVLPNLPVPDHYPTTHERDRHGLTPLVSYYGEIR